MRENYIKGILGALIGGILFSLPWVLVYVYLNYILSLLAAVIALGAFTFYKLFGGMVDKKTPLIIGISSYNRNIFSTISNTCNVCNNSYVFTF